MSDYYDTNHKLVRRFKVLETCYKDLVAEIPPFDQTKVTFKREAGVWYNDQEKLQQLSSNRDWIAAWDPENRWFNFPLVMKDEPIGFAKEICPNTIEMLNDLGGINIAGFSLLLPHSKLPIHIDATGPTHGTMAFNMLLSGEKSSLIVGKSSPYKHKIGRAVLFNSELQHYARNDSDNIRTILYMDIVLRP